MELLSLWVFFSYCVGDVSGVERLYFSFLMVLYGSQWSTLKGADGWF